MSEQIPGMPRRLKVGVRRYEVVTEARRIPNDYAGQHDPQHQEIRVATNQGPDSQRVILLHEVVHAVLEHAGFDQGDEKDSERRKMVEAFIDAMVPGMVLAIEENPQLVEYLRTPRERTA